MRIYFTFLFLLLANPAPVFAETITLVADTWCPYNCNPRLENAGFMVDIAKKAFAKHDIEVTYSVMPWARAIAETRKGNFTAIIGASPKDAPDFIFPATPQGWMNAAFYVKKDSDNWHYENKNSLKTISLGVIEGYSYGDVLDEYINQYKLDPTYIQPMAGDDALAINLSKLARGRIGATVEAKYVMEYYLSQNHLQNSVQEAGVLPPSEQSKLYIAFSSKDKILAQKYADILTQETTAMRKNGELKAILDAYGLVDWE